MNRPPFLVLVLTVTTALTAGVTQAQASEAAASGHTSVLMFKETAFCGRYLRGAEGSGLSNDRTGYGYQQPSPLDATNGFGAAGGAVDFNWLHDNDAELTSPIVYDMGLRTSVVDVFPIIDHGPVPEQEAREFTVYGSDRPNAPFPAGWTTGAVIKVFDNGWNAGWVADDYVSRWLFPDGERFRYVGVDWGGPEALLADGDAEIDAVCTPPGPRAAQVGGGLHTPRVMFQETRNCGTYVSGADDTGIQVSRINYRFAFHSPLVPANGFGAPGEAVDFNWLQDYDPDPEMDPIVFDMGLQVPVVDAFPSIDTNPALGEALEFTIYGSNNPNAAFPSGWAVADIIRIFDNGWNGGWLADNFVSRWRFPSGETFRYVGFDWGGPRARHTDIDAEIDAICRPAVTDPGI